MDRAVIEYLAARDIWQCLFNTHETLCEVRDWCEEINCGFRAVWLSNPDFSRNRYPGRGKSRDCWTRDGRHIEFKTEVGMVAFSLRFGMHTEPADIENEARDFLDGADELEGGWGLYVERHGFRRLGPDGKPTETIYLDPDAPSPRADLRHTRAINWSKIRICI
ncbi:MAG: hypothetical protein ACRYG8_24520 [Janthinobacterium lividum]